MKLLQQNPMVFLGAIWVIFIAIQASLMPLLPIDETRYMTVAWEMYHNKNWILPTLNFDSYSHKPPMLFWLINLVWHVTGVEVWGVRIMNGLIAFASLPLTYVLAKDLFPDDVRIRQYAPIIFMASPMFFIFGTLIMFDFLQAFFVLSALFFLVKADVAHSLKYWALFGLMVGLGVLSKGPVMLVHIIFPALLAPVWASKRGVARWGYWYLKLVFALVIAAAVGLAWALQAAALGGESFSNEIFWSQSAGRMTQSFAHQKPFWFYMPIVLVALLPLVLWPHMWRSVISRHIHLKDKGLRFVLCWIVPTFLAFSFISGKQIHYLVPELAGFSILIACLICSKTANVKEWPVTFWVYLALFMLIQLSPILIDLAGVKDDPFLIETINARSSFVTFAFVAFLGLVTLYFNKQSTNYVQGQLMAFVVMSFLLVSFFSIQMSRKGYEYYDLRPIADYMENHPEKDWAFVHKYQGELGFLAKLDKPISSLQIEDIPQWFEEHSDGLAIIRYYNSSDLKDLDALMTMPYKGKNIGVFKKSTNRDSGESAQSSQNNHRAIVSAKAISSMQEAQVKALFLLYFKENGSPYYL